MANTLPLPIIDLDSYARLTCEEMSSDVCELYSLSPREEFDVMFQAMFGIRSTDADWTAHTVAEARVDAYEGLLNALYAPLRAEWAALNSDPFVGE